MRADTRGSSAPAARRGLARGRGARAGQADDTPTAATFPPPSRRSSTWSAAGRAGRSQGQSRAAVPRLDRDAHLGLGLRQGEAGRHERGDQGGKLLQNGTLTFDRRPGTLSPRRQAAGGRPIVVFEGTLDSSGKLLTLDTGRQVGPGAADAPGQQQLRPLHDGARPQGGRRRQFKPAIEVGLTKEGESFAAGATRPSAQVHRHRRRGHDDRLLPGPDLPDLLHGLPRRVQREPREVHQEAEPQGAGPSATGQDRPAKARASAGSKMPSRATSMNPRRSRPQR